MSVLGIPPGLDDDDPSDLQEMFSEDDQPEDEAPEGASSGEDEQIDSDAPPPGMFSSEAEPETSEEPEEEPPAAEVVEEGEAEEGEEEEQLYAGRYNSLDAFEQGYKEIQGGFTRVISENRELRTALQQQQDQIQQLTQMTYDQMAANDPDLAAQWQEEQRRQAEVAQQVQAQVQPLQNDLQAQRAQATAERAVNTFYQATGITPGSPQDQAVTQSFSQLRQAGVELDITNVDHLAIALEAAANPSFGAELMFAPNALKVPGGLDHLRQRSGATIPVEATDSPGAQPQGSPAGTQSKPRQTERRRVSEAYVETPSGGAPAEAAPGRTPDEFDEAWDYYKSQRSRGPLFGQTG